MSKAEQVALGTTLAGVNQYKVFSAVMTNFKTAIKATNDALGSEGSALRENAKYMESIQAKTQKLKAEFQKFILQGNTLEDTFKKILDVGIKFVQFLNSTQGKIVLISSAVLLLISNFKQLKIYFSGTFIAPFVKMLGSATLAFGNFTVGTMTASEAVEFFKMQLNSLNMNPWMLALSAIILLLASLVIVTYKANKALEEHTEKMKKHSDAIEEAQDNIEQYKEKLQDIQKEIDEINKTGLVLDKNAEDNIRQLKEEQEELKNLIALQIELQKEEQKKANKEAKKVLSNSGYSLLSSKEESMASAFSSTTSTQQLVAGGYLSKDLVSDYGGYTSNITSELQVLTANIKMYSDEFDKLKQKQEDVKRGTATWTQEDQKNLEDVTEKLGTARSGASKLANALQDVKNSATSDVEGFDDMVVVLDDYYGTVANVQDKNGEVTAGFGDLDDETSELEEDLISLKEQYNATDEEIERSQNLLEQLGIKENVLSKEVGMSSIELIRQADAWNMNELALYDYLTAMNKFDESMDNIQSNYKTLQTAIDEYNEMQGFSVDTTQALLRMSPDYLEMLDEVLSGHVTLKDAILEKVKAEALEAKQNIYNTAVERINELATKDNKEATEDQAESFRNSVDDIEAQTKALEENTKEAIKSATTKAYRRGATEQEVQQILDDMSRQLDAVDSMVLAVGKDFSTAMGNNSKSTKDTNNALKEQNNLLKKQKQLLEEKKKQYESVVAYIKKKIQDEIKSIEAEKKAQVDAIKDQIEALKNLKEEELDRIQEQIDALKDQKDIEKEYWQSKIDALKEQNDELKDQLEYEELLENLAKAKSKRVRVYKDGKFNYTEDSNEVDKAQAKINEYERKKSYEEQLKVLENYKKQSENNYDEQIKALEQLKKDKEKNYDQQIKDLEKYQEQVEADYDARIQYFQDYLDKFTKQTDAYENETNRQLAIQLTGIDFEQQGWQTRLDNLADFVEKYNALLGDINTLDEDELADTTDASDNTVVKKTKTEEDPKVETPSANKPSDSTLAKIGNYYSGNSYVVKNDEIGKSKYKNAGVGMSTAGENKPAQAVTPLSNSKKLNQIVVSVGKKASGDSYISDDGMYLVGDSPNQELVIGSKLNGNLMNLTQGSGVVNSTATRTLAGMLNQLGFANQGVNMSNSQNKSTNINIGNISLPSVQNGKDFVDYLQNFSLQMTQEAFA